MLFATATLFLVYATLVAGMSPQEIAAEFEAVKDTCSKKLDKTLEQLINEEKNGDHEKRDCFAACVFKEQKFMTTDGDLDKEEVRKKFLPYVTEETAKKIIETCFDKKKADDCETAAIFHNCIKQFTSKPGPLPEPVKRVYDECKEELHLTEEEADKLVDPDEDVNASCLFACIAKRMGFTTANGALNKEVFIKYFLVENSEEVNEKIIEMCDGIKKANDCETIFSKWKCIQDSKSQFAIYHIPPPKM